MTGGLGLKREEAAAAANFRGSCSSDKQEARGRGLWPALPSRSPGGSEGRRGRGKVEMPPAGSQRMPLRARHPLRSNS